MKSRLDTFIRWLFAFINSLLSNPQRVRVIVIAIVVGLILAAILIPSLTTFAGHMAPQGG